MGTVKSGIYGGFAKYVEGKSSEIMSQQLTFPLQPQYTRERLRLMAHREVYLVYENLG